MTDFSPVNGFIGGLLIGLSASLFLLLNGRVSGISNILQNALDPGLSSFSWSVVYLIGLPLGAAAAASFAPGAVSLPSLSNSLAMLIAAGLLVGFGASLGSGCTSGHGVCGMARLSGRSIVATVVFMAVAMLTVFIVRHVV